MRQFTCYLSKHPRTWRLLSDDVCQNVSFRFATSIKCLSSTKTEREATIGSTDFSLKTMMPAANTNNRKKYHQMTDDDHAKIITAKLKRLQDPEKTRFFDAVCLMGRANSFHFNIMIASKSDPREGDELINKMEKMQLHPCVVTYTAMIDLEVFRFRCNFLDEPLTRFKFSGQVWYAGESRGAFCGNEVSRHNTKCLDPQVR